MKFKKIEKEYFPTVLDRLFRLEPASNRYKRVFDDIINKFSIEKKLKNLTQDEEISLVKEIFNSSFENKEDFNELNNLLNLIILQIEKNTFSRNELSENYLSVDLNLAKMIKETDFSNCNTKNVKWLKKIIENKELLADFNNLKILRKKEALLYPVEKIILCEGQTEFILLETLFKLFNFDLDKEGIFVMASGGKNQVARNYYKMRDYIKLPFFILLDKDAYQIKKLIQPKLRQNDKIYLIKNGEFEDLIPKEILVKTINDIHKNEFNCSTADFDDNLTMVNNLENIFKKYGLKEYKKADFAKELKNFIEQNSTSDDFIESEIKQILEELKK